MRRNLLDELINPFAPGQVDDHGGGAMTIHNFAHSNAQLLQEGSRYLRTSEQAYDESKHHSKAQYVSDHLTPALEDLKERINGGEWDYKGDDQDETAKREEDKRKVLSLLDKLIQDYTQSPGDAASEELVMFHHILAHEESGERMGSPFVILYENLLENYDAYDGDAVSCKPGIQERIRRDAGVKSITLQRTERDVTEPGYDAMKSYHLSYLNRFCQADGNASVLLKNLVAYHIAKRFNDIDNPHDESVESAYDNISQSVKESLVAYAKGMGLPKICGMFDVATAQQLRSSIIESLVGYGGFFCDRAEEIDDGTYDAKSDVDLAKKELIHSLQVECVRYSLKRNLPDVRSWYEVADSGELQAQVLGNEAYIAIVLEQANQRLSATRHALGYECRDIGKELVISEIKDRFSEQGFGPIGLRDIDHDACKRYMNAALAGNDHTYILSCYDSRHLSDEAYEPLKAQFLAGEDINSFSNELISVMIVKSLAKRDGAIDIFVRTFELDVITFVSKYIAKAPTSVINEFLDQVFRSEETINQFLVATDRDNRNALMLAARKGQTEVVQAILARVPEEVLTQVDSYGRNALMLAVRGAQTEVVQAILARVPEEVLMQVDRDNRNALMLAVEKRQTEVVQAILAREDLPKKVFMQVDYHRRNALIWAIMWGHTEVAKAILARDDLPEQVYTQVDCDDRNALMLAVIEGQTEVALAIFARGDLPEQVFTQVDYRGRNALMLAADVGCTEVALAILAREGLPREVFMQVDKNGYNALKLATKNHHQDIERLIEQAVSNREGTHRTGHEDRNAGIGPRV